MPTAAPASGKVVSAHAPLVIGPKLSVAEAARYVGTAAESTEMLMADPVSNVTIPVPAFSVFPLKKARLSDAPAVSQVPLVAVQVNRGIAFTGKAVTPATAKHGNAQVSVKLCPAVNVPFEST